MTNNRRTVDSAALTAKFQRQSATWEVDDAPLAVKPVSNYITPLPKREVATMPQPAWMAPQPMAADFLAPVVTQMEHSDPVTRAKATGLRMVAWGIVWLGAGLITAVILSLAGTATPWSATIGGVLWLVLTAVSAYKVSRLDFDVSSGGVERHRIDRGHDLARMSLQHEYSLKRMALDAWLKSLERDA